MKYKSLPILFIALFTTSLFAAEEAKPTTSGGMQLIQNHSNRTVIIALGDFFPTHYTLTPGATTFAYVSTNRQRITIVASD